MINGEESDLNFKGHNPRKRFGQHWLKDEAVLNQIIKAANLTIDDCVLEVGPGRGALTAKLIESEAGFIHAIELDRDLVIGLNRRFHDEPRFSLKQGDILSVPLEPDNGKVINKVVANIPYNITGPLLKRLIGELSSPLENRYQCLVLLMQKEVAERLVALPGDSNFSALSVRVQLMANCQIVCDVPAKCFVPAPKVDSSVILFKPLLSDDQSLVGIGTFLENLLKIAFTGRRKKLRNTIGSFVTSNVPIDDLVADVGISLEQRPQEISPFEWLALARALKVSFFNENV